MTVADDFIRTRGRPRVEREAPEEPTPRPNVGLVSQGARGTGIPRPVLTTEELFRRAIENARGGSVWERLID